MNYLRTVKDAADAFFWLGESICLVGHTHVPACFTTTARGATRPHLEDISVVTPAPGMDDGSLQTSAVESVILPRDGRAIINPGSVGQPRDRDPRASYAILDLDRSVAEFQRVAYDVEEAMRRTIAAGLPGILGERLAIGA